MWSSFSELEIIFNSKLQFYYGMRQNTFNVARRGTFSLKLKF